MHFLDYSYHQLIARVVYRELRLSSKKFRTGDRAARCHLIFCESEQIVLGELMFDQSAAEVVVCVALPLFELEGVVLFLATNYAVSLTKST